MGTTGQGSASGAMTGDGRSGLPFDSWFRRHHDEAVNQLVRRLEPDTIHDVGCGDGRRVLQWNRAGLTARGSDVSGTMIDRARDRALAEGMNDALFDVRNIYHLESHLDAADLVVCCGVLGQLADPDLALRRLQIAAERYLVISVKREPWASVVNFVCGRYWSTFGRPPWQVGLWSRAEFTDRVAEYFIVEEVLAPFPWTVLLCRAQTDTQVVRHLGAP